MRGENEDNVIRLNTEQMKILDKKAQEEYCIPGLILMENAGLRAFETAYKMLRKRKAKSAFIFCGPGNNGGDGFVVARHLLNHDVKVRVFLLSASDKIKGDALVNYKIVDKLNIPIYIDKVEQKYNKYINSADIIVDCLFGTGLSRNIEGEFYLLIESINSSEKQIISIDIPSGLNGDTGKVWNISVKANLTINVNIETNKFTQ